MFRYKWSTGFVAWIVHRITGVALTLYLFVHLYILSNLRDPEQFESVMSLMSHPLVKVSELVLLVLVATHTLNGARVTLLELGMPTGLQKPLFWMATAGVGVLLVAGGAFFFGGTH